MSDMELMYDKAISKINNNSSTTVSSSTAIPYSQLGRPYKRKSHDLLSKFPWLEFISLSSQFIVVSFAKAVSVQSDQNTAYNSFAFLFNRLECHFKKHKNEHVSLTLAEYIIQNENNSEEIEFIKHILVGNS
jgi:hypothetical protein